MMNDFDLCFNFLELLFRLTFHLTIKCEYVREKGFDI